MMVVVRNKFHREIEGERVTFEEWTVTEENVRLHGSRYNWAARACEKVGREPALLDGQVILYG